MGKVMKRMMKKAVKRMISGAMAVVMLVPVMSGFIGSGEVKAYGNATVNPRETSGRIVAGTYTMGVVADDGYYYTWGQTYYPPDEYSTASTVPRIQTQALNLENIVSAAMGQGSDAVILDDKSLYTWGSNSSYMCGTGQTAGYQRCSSQKIMDNVRSVSMSHNTTLVVTEDNKLYGCGRNTYGELGLGDIDYARVPIKIMDNIKTACAGSSVGAAITLDGDLYVWGENRYGQVGSGTTEICREPKKVEGLKNVTEVSIGIFSIAAVTENGDLYTWGNGASGALGHGEITNRYVPEKIMENVKSVCLGYETGAAITKEGDLYTWGNNQNSALGISKSRSEKSKSNIPIKIMTDVVEVAWANRSGIALTSDDNVWTWGWNSSGQLGIGTTDGESSVPLNVFNLVTGVCEGREYVLDNLYEFNYNKNTYNQELAEKSALYSMLAYDDYNITSSGQYFTKGVSDSKPRLLISKLYQDGFNNTTSVNYRDTNQHNCSYTISNRFISYNGKERTQILVAIRGTDGVEWEGNMKLTGTEYDETYKDTHYSFELAKNDVLNGIETYLSQLKKEGSNTTDCIFWVMGHSRGGAIANLVAADLIDKKDSRYGDVFAYTYATANATSNYTSKSYNNIFNHCFDDDFVPSVPLSSWGYGSYGITYTADADALYSSSAEFNKGMKAFVNASRNDDGADYDSEGTSNLLRYLQGNWSDTEAYYKIEKVKKEAEEEVKEDDEPDEMDSSKGASLYMFMNDAVAKLAQNKYTNLIEFFWYPSKNSKLKKVKTFFLNAGKINNTINDTHQAYAYYMATKLKFFNPDIMSVGNADTVELNQDIDLKALSMYLTEEGSVSENSAETKAVSENSILVDTVSSNSISSNNISSKGVLSETNFSTGDLPLVSLSLSDEKQRLLDFMKSGDNADNFTWNENDITTWTGVTFDVDGYITELNLDFMKLSGNLDLSGFERLQTLNCMGNELNSINVTNCTSLEELDCSYNSILSKLDISGCNSLKSINCEMNDIEEINLSDCANLEKLRCGNNQIANLDLSVCTQLKTLMCKSNILNNIVFPVENNLTRINCEYNYLTDLSELETMAKSEDKIILYQNQNVPKGSVFSESEVDQLRSFATTKQNLDKLGWDLDNPAEWFGIEWVNVEGTYYISKINLNGGELEGSFVIDGYKELFEVQISENKIDSLEIKNCPQLIRINCVESGIERVIISDCTKLSEIYAYYNYITDEQLSIIEKEYSADDTIVELYPQYVKASEEEYAQNEVQAIRSFMNLEHNKEYATIDENPGHWEFVKWEVQEDGLYHIVDISLEWLWVSGKLDLSTFKYLTGIDCANSKITEIVLPKNLGEIPNRAFYNCDMLIKVVIPESVTKIGRTAFGDCNNLSIVSFLGKNSTIAENAFYKSEKIQTVECYSLSSESKYKYDGTPEFIYWDVKKDNQEQKNQEQTNQNNNDTKDNSDNATKAEDTTKLPKKGAKYTISTGVYKVTKSSAKNGTVAYIGTKNKKAKTVTIPASIKINGVKFKVTSISSSACKSMTKLQTVNIGNNVTTVGAKAFYNCKKLKKVTIGKNVKMIKSNAFANCKSLKTIKVNSGVLMGIGKNAFKGINKKATITVPKSKKAVYKKLLTKKAVKMSKGVKIK